MSLSAAEKRAYHAVTELARHEEGYLICQVCGHSIPEGSEHRAHEPGPGTRKQKTLAGRVRILCPPCHSKEDHYGGLPIL